MSVDSRVILVPVLNKYAPFEYGARPKRNHYIYLYLSVYLSSIYPLDLSKGDILFHSSTTVLNNTVKHKKTCKCLSTSFSSEFKSIPYGKK